MTNYQSSHTIAERRELESLAPLRLLKLVARIINYQSYLFKLFTLFTTPPTFHHCHNCVIVYRELYTSKHIPHIKSLPLFLSDILSYSLLLFFYLLHFHSPSSIKASHPGILYSIFQTSLHHTTYLQTCSHNKTDPNNFTIKQTPHQFLPFDRIKNGNRH